MRFFPQPEGQTIFEWLEQDFSSRLPADWDQQILEFARNHVLSKILVPRSVTSRELNKNLELPTQTVGGVAIRDGLPWLYELYHTDILAAAQAVTQGPVFPASDDRYAINLNVQSGTSMRYEAHVDSNPIEGLLYVTTHEPGEGGELVVALDQAALGPEQISSHCVRIYPKRGQLVFFDARAWPHYVAPLCSETAQRVVVAMNYYTAYSTEAERPADLNAHLGLE